MTIAENLVVIQSRIDAACAIAGRDPGTVRLLPVSKTHGIEKIREARAAGYHLFGENKVQELAGKCAVISPDEGISFALIGHLQTNKAKVAAELASEFHALDSLKLAAALNRHCENFDRSLDVFVQVNSSGEDSKFGLSPEEVAGFARELAAFDRLNVVGLMTLAVFSHVETEVAACFQRMVDVRQKLRDEAVLDSEWNELSMGMSGDFELAIQYGATVVRVGEAIFGSRLRPQDYWPGVK